MGVGCISLCFLCYRYSKIPDLKIKSRAELPLPGKEYTAWPAGMASCRTVGVAQKRQHHWTLSIRQRRLSFVRCCHLDPTLSCCSGDKNSWKTWGKALRVSEIYCGQLLLQSHSLCSSLLRSSRLHPYRFPQHDGWRSEKRKDFLFMEVALRVSQACSVPFLTIEFAAPLHLIITGDLSGTTDCDSPVAPCQSAGPPTRRWGASLCCWCGEESGRILIQTRNKGVFEFAWPFLCLQKHFHFTSF